MPAAEAVEAQCLKSNKPITCQLPSISVLALLESRSTACFKRVTEDFEALRNIDLDLAAPSQISAFYLIFQGLQALIRAVRHQIDPSKRCQAWLLASEQECRNCQVVNFMMLAEFASKMQESRSISSLHCSYAETFCKEMSTLVRGVQRLWTAYERQLSRAPVVTQVATSTVLWSAINPPTK